MAVDPGRLNLSLVMKQGNLPLTDLSALKNLQIIDDKMSESTGMVYRVVETGTTVTFTLADMGVVKGRFVYVESDQDVTATLTSTGVVNPAIFYITPPTDDPTGQIVDTNVRRVGMAMIKGKDVLTVAVTNASGNQANVRLLACGYDTDS